MLCGRLSVTLDGVERVGALRGRQVPLLLVYLVLNRSRPVGREELIGALWAEAAPRSQDAALRTLLSRLRSALGRDVLHGRDELSLTLADPVWIDHEAAVADLAHARSALARGDPRAASALAQAALAIAGRGLLPGSQAGWLEPFRRELGEVRLQAHEVAGRAGLELGAAELGSVERAARSLIDTEPYRESGYVLLMEALEGGGNVAEGLRVFESLRTLLRDELGTAPSPEAMTVHERLLHPGLHDRWRTAATGASSPELPPELQARGDTPLVGRRGELERLQEWRGSSDGARVMLVSGDPGIGKTRLIAQLARRAHDEGAIVLAGRAVEEMLVPYQPLLEAIGQYVAVAPTAELSAVARDHGTELARLIPELRRRLPALGPAASGDPETDRYRLFEDVAGMLGRIAAARPLLIVLDDLHWADRPTLLLLRHLARSPLATRLLILGAHRAGERRSEGFDAALASLRHERLVAQLELGGLGAEEASELIRLRAGEVPSLAFAQALYAETEGNPFFIEEIVRHLADSGLALATARAGDLERAGLPQDVRDVIVRRLQRLDDGVTEWLRVAAVIGRDFDSALLERVLGYDEERFLGGLEDAIAAGLVAERPGERGRYGFAHALIRDTLYEGMSSARRGRLHRRIGISLEQEDPDRHVGALAYHFTRAAEPQDAERAIRYALQAGRQATAMLANEEAAEHYARALETLERADPDAKARRCELLLELGEARERSGERPQAWGVFREAASLAVALGDREALVRAAIGASRRYVQPAGLVDEDLIALLERALEMAAAERSVTRVLLLSRLCGALYFSDRRERMAALADEATSIAAQLGDPRAAALAAAARRRAHWGPNQLARRLDDSTQLLAAATAAGDAELVLQGRAWLVVDLLERGDRGGAEVEIDAFAAGALALRQPLFLWNAEVWRAMLALLDGRLEESERLAASALAIGNRSDAVTAPQYYAIQLMGIRREQARMGELEAPLRAMIDANPARPAWRGALALLLSDAGRVDEARAQLELLVRDGLETISRDGDWLIAMTVLADAAAELEHRPAAATLYELLAPSAEAVVVIGLGSVCQGAAARYLGRLALTLGRRDEALAHLRRALSADTALRAPVALAYTQLHYAQALGDGPEARALIAAATAGAAERGLPRVLAQARRAAGS